jgi:hypothetical protein
MVQKEEKKSRWGRDFLHTSRPALGPTQPPVQWVPGLSRGLKRLGRDADHSPPSSAEVTKKQSYTSIHPLGQFRPVTRLLFFLVLQLRQPIMHRNVACCWVLSERAIHLTI